MIPLYGIIKQKHRNRFPYAKTEQSKLSLPEARLGQAQLAKKRAVSYATRI